MDSEFSIVGAGISGLTAGCALQKISRTTHVYEKLKKINEFGAGISLSPNGTKPLQRLGVLNDLIKTSHTPDKIVVRSYSSGKEIVSISLNEKKQNKFLTLDRKELIQILLKRYMDLGGIISTSCEVSKIDNLDKDLVFSDGRRVSSDVILACDGIKSKIRELYFDNTKPSYTNYVAWRGISDIGSLPKLKDNQAINLWYGPEGHVVHYPIGRKGKVNFVGIKVSNIWTEQSWRMEADKEDLLRNYQGWHEELLKFLTSPKKIYKWGLFERPEISSLKKDNIALLGDAAHPMVPFMGQGGCIAIEDSYCFGLIFSKIRDKEKALKIYQTIRLKRGNWIQRRSKIQALYNHMSNSTLVKIRNFISRRLFRKAVSRLHAFDIHKETLFKIS